MLSFLWRNTNRFEDLSIEENLRIYLVYSIRFVLSRLLLAFFVLSSYNWAMKTTKTPINSLSFFSHEIKSQLFGIKAYAQLLERYSVKTQNAKSEEYAKRITLQVDKVSHAISDFIDFLRITNDSYSIMPEFLSIDDVVKQVVKVFSPLFLSGSIAIIGATAKKVIADRAKLEKVLYSILTNAAVYAKDNPKITIFLKDEAKGVSISVEDNGIGIKKSQLDKIFQPFYYVPIKNHGERIGLGLFVAKKIIQKHGGRISVASVEGKGSTFTLFLPE